MKPKSTRPKFETRKFLLSKQTAVDGALGLIRNLPIDPDRPLEVVVREPVKGRSLDANAYYWLRLGEIAQQAFIDGKQFDSEVWHTYLKRNVMPEQVTLKDGSVRSKWVEQPDGELDVISTTKLEKSCFHDYTLCVEVFGAELGVRFSANPREVPT